MQKKGTDLIPNMNVPPRRCLRLLAITRVAPLALFFFREFRFCHKRKMTAIGTFVLSLLNDCYVAGGRVGRRRALLENMFLRQRFFQS